MLRTKLRQGRGIGNIGGRGHSFSQILNWVDREDLTKKLIAKHSPEDGEAISHEDIWGDSVLGKGHGYHRGTLRQECACCPRTSKENNMRGTVREEGSRRR